MAGGLVSDDDRVQRLEYALFGLRGDNGLISEVRQLRAEFARYREDERERREEERRDKRTERRWQIGTALAIITAILTAASIIASSV